MAEICEQTEPFLQSRAQIFVLPVNSTGNLLDRVSNRCKGLYPDNYQAFRQACQRGELPAGSLLMQRRQRERFGLGATSNQNNPDYIANLVVSDHPYHPMRQLWLENALTALTESLMRPIRYQGIRHIAIHCKPLIYENDYTDENNKAVNVIQTVGNPPHNADTQLNVPVMQWDRDIKPIMVHFLAPLPKLRVDLHLPKFKQADI